MASEVKAARYVRMSTDMQEYSIENQVAAIDTYASAHGLVVVRSYEDAARSGLRLERRKGLQSLLSDVLSGCAEYQTILVYDVSRWGRFQDADESAYYEFLCKRSGVSIEYCSELFRNDGSITTTIVKNMKRAMAGEYSRELSIKVATGKRRLAELGYRVSGAPGYGLRRALIDRSGNTRMVLETGEHKGVSTDRTVLTRGPDHEVETVRRIFDLLLDSNFTCPQIAAALNADGIISDTGRPWNRRSIASLLRNPKYIGTNQYGRSSRFLCLSQRKNPATSWVQVPNAFDAIVSPERFQQAQYKLDDWHTPYSTNDLLDYLTALWCVKGRLDRPTIREQPHFPTLPTIAVRFGNLSNCLRQLGYRQLCRRIRNIRLREQILKDLCIEIEKRGGSAQFLPRREHVRVNREFIVTVCLGRTIRQKRIRRWRFIIKSQRKADVTIIARIDDRIGILDYYILPTMFALNTDDLGFSGRTYARLEGLRYQSLTHFYDLCGRTSMEA